MNIIEKDHWDVCFGDEEHKAEIVKGSKNEATNYLNSLKDQTWEGGRERIDNYINNELEEDSTTIIFFNYDNEVFAVISLEGFKKKLEKVCSEDEEKEMDYPCAIEELAKKKCLEHATLELLGDDGKIIEIKGFFSEGRVSDYEIPEGYIKFEIRSSDDDDSIYATLEKNVRVNYACTFITNDKTILPLVEEREYLEIADWNYGESVAVTYGGGITAGDGDVYVVLHEYDHDGECGSSVCGVFKSFEKAKEKLNLVSANEFEEAKSVWGEDAVFNRDGDVCFIANNVACQYDNFRIETAYLE